MSDRRTLPELLGSRYPLVQAPMAGGGDTPALVAAVSEAGALGFVGAAYLTPSQTGEACRAIRALTARPFGINLFAPLPVPEAPSDPALAVKRVAAYYEELGLPAPELAAPESYTSTNSSPRRSRAARPSSASRSAFCPRPRSRRSRTAACS